ncbi:MULTISPECIES: DUF2141 domain-containing protein [Sphingomonadaceae]|jgi:uncharacterized protein (DUF2141 family)|uniref:DUF2141 domain-containing protein n=1 Tax=Sphingomonadaceae TaxID=41297 RepID=UPI0010BD630F|nr:DUF2141 domain-containing protein [Novosphingobium sp. EMRT-2]QCI92936.1 DUF2141 domain-containing protein [Novosphingobium sp. EMRT-2]
MISAALMLLLGAALPSTPDLGKAEGQCRPHETGPSLLVDVAGLKDRRGRLKLELYPANDDDFLQDDNILINAGKTFRRVEVNVPSSGPVELCIRAPAAGRYSLSLLHDRNADRKFSLSIDGIGFGGNPRLGMSKPKAAAASVLVGEGPTRVRIVMNYRKGLISFGPLER